MRTMSGDHVRLIDTYFTMYADKYFTADGCRIDEDGDTDFEIGGDLRWRPSSALGVDLTVNPDFALIEADVEVINLTRFELFIPERRPFFLEGTEILFDCCQISQRVSFAVPVADLAVVPHQDLAGLGADCRMNTPSVGEGNWTFRITPWMMGEAIQRRLANMVETYGRGPERDEDHEVADSIEDAPDRRQEPHVGHAVRFVDDHDVDLGEIDRTLLDQVLDGDQAGHAAILVDHDGHVDAALLQETADNGNGVYGEAGVDTVRELKHRNPENLYAKMVEANEAKNLVRRMPSERQVIEWVNQANHLIPKVTY